MAGAVVAGAAILAPGFASSQPGSGGSADASAAAVCPSVVPARLPAWTASGSWTPEGDLLLLDNLAKTLVRLSPQGHAIDARLPPSFASYLSRWYPAAIARHGEGYLIQVNGNRFASVDRRYSLGGIHPVSEASGDGTPVIDKVFSWTVAGDDVYAVADVRMPDGEGSWWSGFVRIPLSNPRAVELIEPVDDQERVFYRLSHSYLASTKEGVAYVLRMSNQMGLYRFERGAGDEGDEATRLEPVRSFEKLYPHPSLSPQLPIFKSPDDLVTVMRVVEQARMPVGLYGGEGLYVLSRNPVGRATEWSVGRLSPESDRLLWSSTLPSRANHISVVPGPDHFAFVEKGPVRGMAVQSVKSLLLVPTSRMKLDRVPSKLCG